MKILIVGAGGQLGREWVHYLTRTGNTYIAYDSDGLDITSVGEIDAILGDDKPDVVINCAAYTNVDGAEDHRDKAWSINERGAANLSAWCFRHQAKLIHFSTDYVFPGLAEDRDRYPGGYPEDAKKNPLNVYGASKLAGETAVIESGAAHLIIRVSWLCGQFGSNFVKTMVRLGSERESLSVVNDQFGSPSFTDNVVYNTYNLIRKEASGVWHISSEGLVNWYEFARQIFEVAGMNVDVIPVPSSDFAQKAKRPSYSKLSVNKLQKVDSSVVSTINEGLRGLLADI